LDGTPDARTIYYNYPTSGDGAVIARLDPIAAAKNPARNPTRDKEIRYCPPNSFQTPFRLIPMKRNNP